MNGVSEKPFSIARALRILSSPTRDGDAEIGQYQFFMGRDALAFCLDALGYSPRNNVLFPAYTCVEPLRPFLDRGCRVFYYDTNEKLELDLQRIDQVIQQQDVDTFFWINYFGLHPRNLTQVLALCRKKGIFLIEDCSHSLLSQGSGCDGDLVFYSYRKLLPVPDGGTFSCDQVGTAPTYRSRWLSNVGALALLAKTWAPLRTITLKRGDLAQDRLAHSRLYWPRVLRCTPPGQVLCDLACTPGD